MNPPSKRPRRNNTNESDVIRDSGADNPFLVATPAHNARTRTTTEDDESAPPSVSLANYTAGARTTRVAPSLATVSEAPSSVATSKRANPFGTDATRPLYSYTAVRPTTTRPIVPTTGYPTTSRRPKMPMQYSVEPTPARSTRNAISADLLDSTRINRWLDAATGTKTAARKGQDELNTTLHDRLKSTSDDVAEENENTNENGHDYKKCSDKDVSLLNLDAYVLEAVEAKQKVGELVYELASQRTETERKLLEAATFAQRLQQQLKERIQRVEKLEEDRRYLYASDNSTKAKLEELKETHERYQNEKEKEISRLQENETKLKDELAVLRETARSDQSGSYHQIRTLQTKNQGYEQELELLRTKLAEQTEFIQKQQAQLQETQAKLSEKELELQTIRATGDSSVASTINAKRLQNQVTKIQELETLTKAQNKELDHYRTNQRRVNLLEEEKKRLTARVEQIENYRAKYDELEIECAILRKEKSEWAEFLGKSSNDTTMTSPYKMSSTLLSQRIELVALTEQQGKLQARIRQLELNLENAQQLNKEQEAKYKELEAKRDIDQCEIKRYQRKHRLAQKEIDFLREQVNSYDIENAMQNGENYDKQKTERIEMLEKLIDEYQQENIIASSSSAATATAANQIIISNNNNNNNEKALLDKIESLTAENQSLSKQVTTQDDYITRLEYSTGHGDYNRANIRVLEFSNNLAVQDFAIRASTLESLRKENKELLDKLKQYRGINPTINQEETTKVEGESLDTVPFQSLLNEQAEKAQLEEELATKTKRMQRLREVFAAKGRELRDVIYSLLGYKLELLPNGRVRLTSAYSSRDDHSFVFSSNDNDRGVMQLVNSGNDDFANSLQSLIRLWVGERGSIPGFLSAVTLELFERQDNPIGVDGMRVMDMSNDDIELGAF